MDNQDDIFFELIDLRSGNVIGDFASVEDALESLRQVAQRHGWTSVEHLSLMRIRDTEQRVLGMNERLVEMARFQPVAQART